MVPTLTSVWVTAAAGLSVVLLCCAVLAYHRRRRTEQRTLRSALESLAESENRFRLVFEHGGVGMALLTRDGRCVEVNPALERMLGYSSAELRGRRLSDFSHPEEDTTRFHLDQLQDGVHAQDERERRYLHKDGHTVWAHLLRVHVRNPAGQVSHAVSVLVDITERRRAEERLRAERDFSTQVLQTADALILVVDAAGAIVRFNGKCSAVSGYTEAEAQGHVLWDFLLSSGSVESVRDAFQRLLASATACVMECAWKTRSGEERLIAWRFTSVRDDMGFVHYVIGAGLDITDQRRLEEQLRHSQKMETLGTLVGGIAHDFNNQLTAILGNVGLALLELNGITDLRLPEAGVPAPVRAALANLRTLLTPLSDAESAAQRCAEMTRRLLAFGRTRMGQPQPLNLNELLTEVTRLFRRVLPATINVDVQTDPELFLVKADSTQLHQALMNLAVNARDAMPQGGQLTFRTANRTLSAADCARNMEARPGKFVVLTVTDTGCGMPAEVLTRIFEPFFTTKDVDKGTGLGLAMVFGTIKAHRGWIVVDSAVGRGTTFEIWLPAQSSECRNKDDGAALQRSGAASLAPVESGCVLVVDDEQLIRNYAACLLERVGYQVLTAADGEEALRVYREHASTIDVVILDYTMPKMTGLQVLEELRTLEPDVKVIFSSGYAPKYDAKQLLEAGACAFVAKPYQPQELLRVVRAVLDRKHSRPAAAPAA